MNSVAKNKAKIKIIETFFFKQNLFYFHWHFIEHRKEELSFIWQDRKRIDFLHWYINKQVSHRYNAKLICSYYFHGRYLTNAIACAGQKMAQFLNCFKRMACFLFVKVLNRTVRNRYPITNFWLLGDKISKCWKCNRHQSGLADVFDEK